MYRAIICDDEETVRSGLSRHFDWHAHNIELVGVFEDGQPAWEYVKTHEIEIVITDVRMIHMDGITLAKRTMEIYPDVKTLFISGYADVSYLKDALKIDAVDYILKSVDLNELDTAVTKIISMLNRKNREQQIMQDMEEKLEKSMPLLKLRRLSELLKENGEKEDELEKSVMFLDIPLDSRTRYAVMVMRIRHKSRHQILNHLSEKERQELGIAVEELFTEVVNSCCRSVAFKETLLDYVAIIDVSGDQYEKNLLNTAEQLYQRVSSELNIDTAVGISEPFVGLQEIQRGYADACEAISKSYLISRDVPISIKKYKDDDNKTLREYTEKEMANAILEGDSGRIHKVLSGVMLHVREAEGQNVQQNFMLFLLLLPIQLLNNIKTENMGVYANQSRLLQDFLQCRDLNEQQDMIASLYEETAEHLKKMSNPHTNTVVKCVCEIIETQYMEQISVTSLAEMVNLTPAYLCVLFKQAMGKTINEYLTQQRLNQAKNFLAHSSIHLYDVCYRVGYFSPSYFSRMFKKYIGVTPREYRENALVSLHTQEKDGRI